ncbi:hypothetical protein FHG87_026078, partial [Trinorchestia longiramus]
GGKDQYSSKAQPTKLVSVGTQTGDELISLASPNVTVTQLVELLARTLTAVTRQDEDLNLKDLIIEIAKDTFKSQVLNTSANNERPLTAQPQYNDCSDPSNLMTTLDLPTTQVTPSPILGRANPRKRHKTNAQTSSTATKNKSLLTSEKQFRTKKQVIECELHTIHEALSWISENSAPSDKYVIFTDSLSSLYLICSKKPRYYIPLIYNLQNKLINIISSHCIRLQFIPGHRGG